MIVLLNLGCKHSSKSINYVVYNTIASSCLLLFLLPPALRKNQGIRISVAFNDSLEKTKKSSMKIRYALLPA